MKKEPNLLYCPFCNNTLHAEQREYEIVLVCGCSMGGDRTVEEAIEQCQNNTGTD